MAVAEGRGYRYRTSGPLDLRLTLAPLAHGHGDPTIRLGDRSAWRVTRTADGPASLELRVEGAALLARAWGPGRERVLAGVPALVGEDDDRQAFRPGHGLVGELARRFPGMRLTRSGAVFEALLPAVLEQKVTGIEARRSYRALVRRHGAPAPGPLPLRLPPLPRTLAGMPYEAYHPCGVERRRADTIRRAAAVAPRLEEVRAMDRAAADRRLRAVPGIGGWTSAEVRRSALGDADAVSLGDYHLPNLVCWALAGESRGSDERMLELLEPYRGQRARVQRLLEVSGLRPPAFGPRLAARRIHDR